MDDTSTPAGDESASRMALTRELLHRASWRPQLHEMNVGHSTSTPVTPYELSMHGRPIVPVGWPEIADLAPDADDRDSPATPADEFRAEPSKSPRPWRVRRQSPAVRDDWKQDGRLIDRMRNALEATQSRRPVGDDSLTRPAGPHSRAVIEEGSAPSHGALAGIEPELSQVIRNLPGPMAAAAIAAGVFNYQPSMVSSAPTGIAADASRPTAVVQRAMPVSAEQPTGLLDRTAAKGTTASDRSNDQELDQLAEQVYARLRWRLVAESERLMQ